MFEGSVHAGHVTSLVRSKNENVFRRFNDDAVFDLRRRIAMKALKENRFGFEPEITLKISKLNLRIYEVGVRYFGRTYKEGKKINWKDGFSAIRCIIKYFITD